MNKFREQLEQAINSNYVQVYVGQKHKSPILSTELTKFLVDEFGVTTLKFGAYPGPIGEIWKPHFTIQYGE